MGINSSIYQHQCNGFSKKSSSRFSHSQYTKKEMGEKVLREVITEQDVNIYDDSIHRTHDPNKISKHCHYENQKSQFRPSSQCGHCRIISKRNCTNQEIKKYKSEPDLRYLMAHEAMLKVLNSRQKMQEIRYRSKKKYKAPPPPRGVTGNSKFSEFQIQSSDKRKAVFNEEKTRKSSKNEYSVKYHLVQSSQSPKKSRLFKSREQSKNSQVTCSLCSLRRCTQHKVDGNDDCSIKVSIIDDDDDDDDDENNLTRHTVRKEKNLVLHHEEINSCNSSVRKRFLNWNNKNFLQSNNTQSRPIQSTYKINYESFEKDSSSEIKACYLIKKDREKNQPQFNSLQQDNLSSKISQNQRENSVFINDERNKSEITNFMETQNQKSVNNTFSNLLSLNTENLDKIQDLMTNHQSYILKSYNDNNNLHQLKKPKSTSLHREINDIKLLNDENYLTIQKSTNDHTKIDIDEKENKLNKSETYSSTNEANKCIKESRYFVDFLSKESCIRNEGSEEENNCFNIPSIKNKKNIAENPKGLCRKDDDILSGSYVISNKNPLSKRDKNSSSSIQKEISQTGAESKSSSSYLNQSTNTFPIFNYSRIKTFYFGMDNAEEFNQDYQQQRQTNGNFFKSNNLENDEMNIQSETEGIALSLRPTLPKKPPEIPRFSPSDAWKLLTEASEPTSSAVSDEIPVTIHEQKDESYPLLITYQRNTHDKSGDSGISAEGGGDLRPLRTTWTPQQDLDDESSGDDALYNSPHENSFQLQPHVFSLSLPRSCYAAAAAAAAITKTKQEMLLCDSLQKLKHSVSGVFGFTPQQHEDKPSLTTNTLDDNWFLSSSAPTSLQNYYINNNDEICRLISTEDTNEETGEKKKKTVEANSFSEIPQFSSISKAGHVMYLPDTFNNSNLQFTKRQQQIIKYKKYKDSKNTSYYNENTFNNTEKNVNINSSRKLSKSCENVSCETRIKCPQSSNNMANKNIAESNKNNYMNDVIKDINKKIFNRPRKFTFQSTVRQIERRRLAEKLSKEAEAKENQRKNELDAMIKVEEEFQKKRNKENII
ncbi:putative uncharacterized protein DDB_G0282133 [Leptopilina heterotoma]|uniref:putative uncharacterized protein DDB_G0282133 n=1 Tax=Leptopilina heterotoma TaxID=63436 RepID=UPI001CA86967|nr:putative uncharacterized protein DDB_G0282133 [Leptopilina heterotoma]